MKKLLIVAVIYLFGVIISYGVSADNNGLLYALSDSSVLELHPTSFTINGHDGAEAVRIELNTGKVTYGRSYTPDKASDLFWEAVERMGAKRSCNK